MNNSLFSEYSDIEANFNECSEAEQINKIIEDIYKFIKLGAFIVREDSYYDGNHNKKEFIAFDVAECSIFKRIEIGRIYNDLYNYEMMMPFLSFSNAKLNIATLFQAIEKTFQKYDRAEIKIEHDGNYYDNILKVKIFKE